MRNLSFDLNRRFTAENRHPANEETLQGLPSEAPSPECEALYSDELQRLEAALARLSIRSRHAFVMHRLHGMTFKDIAQRLVWCFASNAHISI
ncbi:sigma factor-like helix-turn-helix DNA-binding protein [Pseudomonas sp. BP6]|uniref:sigma factor-like helix-turn-helix DNA-binding protein n=1 Tax=unclassified Pseudomonas TaxID=196821 RepID=UPI001D2B4FF1|nr:DNA-directed RNA polymerase specialized sigma24 family protein [Pseudomonas sp. BP6]MBP2290127.1 DNA-directed RNA polymerase specialized sigma24 family protein [Pseudomonas sp. BP7]